jgi:hypothetical protein
MNLYLKIFMILLITWASTGIVECQVFSSDLPNIKLFSISPRLIDPGSYFELSWEVENADERNIAEGIGDVPPSGSRNLTASTTTTYVLTAKHYTNDPNKKDAQIADARVYIRNENETATIANTSGFSISNVKDGDLVAQKITLIGKCPANFEDDLWVFVVAPNGNFYPQTANAKDDNWRTPILGNNWETTIGLGQPDEDGKFFTILLATADKDASKIISEMLKKWSTENYYPGWKRLPSGVKELKRVNVIRNAEKFAWAPKISNVELPGDVHFTNIKEDATVSWQMDLLGNCTTDIKDHIWVLVRPAYYDDLWYPQSINPCGGIHVQKAGLRWRSWGTFGDKRVNNGDPFDVVAVLANDKADKFFDDKQREWCENNGTYPGLFSIELPQGIQEKDRVRVYRR